MTHDPKHQSPGSALLEQLLPEWRRTLPASVSPAYFDGFVARNRAQLIARLDPFFELYAKLDRDDKLHRLRKERIRDERLRSMGAEHRPKDAARAIHYLDSRIFHVDWAFTLGGRRYHDPERSYDIHEIAITMQASMIEGEHSAPRLIVYVSPRDARLPRDNHQLAPLLFRGELIGASGEVSARFDWQPITLANVLELSDEQLGGLLGLAPTAAAPAAKSVTEESAAEESTEDTLAQALQDRRHINHALLPQRWAAELALLDNMLLGDRVPETGPLLINPAINTRRQLEGRGVLYRRGGAFEIQGARPVEWVITPGLALFARGQYYGSGPKTALGVLGRTLHRLGYPAPEPALGPAFGVGRTRAKPHDELRRLLDTLNRQGIDPSTVIAMQWVVAIEMNLPIPLAPVPPEVRSLIRDLSQANMSPRSLERQGVARAQWDAHALPPLDKHALPPLYQALLAQGSLDGDTAVDELAASLPVQLGDRPALAREILDDLTDKHLRPRQDTSS